MVLFNSPGRNAGERIADRAIGRSIPGLPAWAIKEFPRIRILKDSP
jgi:hypothetical protein